MCLGREGRFGVSRANGAKDIMGDRCWVGKLGIEWR